MSVKFGWGGVGGVSSIQVYFGFLDFFYFAKPLSYSRERDWEESAGDGFVIKMSIGDNDMT